MSQPPSESSCGIATVKIDRLHKIEQQWVDLLARSLADHYQLVESSIHPDESTKNDDVNDNDDDKDCPCAGISPILIDQARKELERRGCRPSNIDPILRMAREKAWMEIIPHMQRPHSEHGHPRPAKSFSIFMNQFHPGGLADDWISWDRFEQLDTVAEKLALLQKVQYMDDLVPDWDAVCRLLRTGLNLTTTSTATEEPETMVMEFVRLHRKWFHFTRSSNGEYRSIQIDLVQNLVDTVEKNSRSRESSDQEKSKNVDKEAKYSSSSRRVQNSPTVTELCIYYCYDMFEDWVDRLSGLTASDTRMYSIGKHLWQWTASESIRHVMVYHSPYANMFRKWIPFCLTTDQTLELTTTPTPCTKQDHHILTSDCILSNLYKLLEIHIRRFEEQGEDIGGATFNLSLFAAILIATRVSRFPWHLLFLDNTHHSNPCWKPADSILRLFHCSVTMTRVLYAWKSVPESCNFDPQITVMICTDVIATLVSGCVDGSELNLTRQKMREILIELERTVTQNDLSGMGQIIQKSIAKSLAELNSIVL
jgi:hypothetical protein